MLRSQTILFCGACVLAGAAMAARPQQTTERFNWPSFRGPFASGVADGQHPPTAWDPETGLNVLWSTPIPGLGHSSPIVWGDRIFLTTAVSEDPDAVFRYGTDGRQDRRSDRARNAWFVYAIDRRSGDVAWAREVTSGNPKVQRHPKNSYASATPATDGTHVVVLVATGGLFCYDVDGALLWDRDLGPLDAGASYDETYQWGAASSPIIWQRTVIVQADQQQGSFVAAFDITTGEEVWRTPRDLISSFSTPTIHVGPERTELVTNGAGTMHGYNPATGEELWRMSGSSLNTAPTPVSAEGLVYVASGYRTQPIFAIRPGAVGDISLADGETSSAQVAWSSPRDGPYITTPLVYRGYLYVVSANGVLTVFDAATGARAYKQRIGEIGGAYSASPVAADGRIYLTSEDGDIFVVKAGPEYELLATNRMGEVCLATPAISEGQMFIRTTGHLLAVTDGIAPRVSAARESRPTSFPAELPARLVLPFDDFEDGDLRARTGVRWQTFTDGVSSAALRLVDAGAASTSTAARLDGALALGAVRGPLAQMYVPFDRGAVPVNLEHLGGIRFYVRSSRAFDLTFRCADGEFGKELEPSEQWRLVELGADELMPVPADATGAWNGTECVGLYFSRRGAASVGDFWFEVDEITLYGASAWTSIRVGQSTR
jgi:outer membrane protein assembly factor BamB